MSPAAIHASRRALLFIVLASSVAACGPALRGGGTPPGPPPPGPAVGERSFRLVVISDTNGRYGSIEPAPAGAPEALATIRGALRPDLVVHNGDQIAGGGRYEYPPEQIDAMWTAFHATITDVILSAGIPLLPVPGNHDVFPAPLAEAYAERWTAPGIRPDLPWTDDARYPRRYSLRYRGAELIVWDAPSGRMSAEELRWLQERLAAAADADLRIVFSHVPIEPLTSRDYGSLRPLEDVYAVLVAGGTSLLVTSHDEVYFDGYFRDLRVLATGGLGQTCRNLRGQEACQGMSFAVVDVEEGRLARTFAMAGRGFSHTFDQRTLPRSVGEDYWRP